MLILIKTTEDKNTQELEYTQEEHADSNLSIDPDFSSEGIISTEKKSLAIAQFQIAKHEQILQKREEEKKKRKAIEERKKQATTKKKQKNKSTNSKKAATPKTKGKNKKGKTVPIASNPITNYAVATPSSASIPFTIATATPSPALASNSNSGLCRGCGMVHDSCHEHKYRNLCLHSVLDYMERVGYDYATENGIMEAYIVSYHTHLKRDLLADTYFYELDNSIKVPVCMENGSMKDALYMRRTHSLMKFLKGKHIYDVHQHVRDIADGIKPRVRYPEYKE